LFGGVSVAAEKMGFEPRVFYLHSVPNDAQQKMCALLVRRMEEVKSSIHPEMSVLNPLLIRSLVQTYFQLVNPPVTI